MVILYLRPIPTNQDAVCQYSYNTPNVLTEDNFADIANIAEYFGHTRP